MRPGLTAVVAVLGLAASCGADDARPVAVSTVATTTTVAPDVLVELPEVRPSTSFVRLIPPAAASRGGERSSGSAGKARDPRSSAPAASVGTGGSLTVSSTAYCETGGMANGQRTYDGAVAMNGQPMGSRWHVLSGPYAGRTLTVADRIGHGSSFDIAMPGRCAAAVAYGRRQITIERVG